MASTAPPVQLGELNCPSALDALFQLGELVARTNADGGLVLPDFLHQVSMVYPLSRWRFDAPEQVLPDAFTPAKAASQFADLADVSLQTILAGYARLAYQLLEPHHPGFTDGLLAQLLPGAEAVVPRAVRFDIGRVLRAYGAALAPEPEAALALSAPAPPPVSATDEELLLATLAVFAAHMNLRAWLLHLAACEPKRELSQLLTALVKGKFYVSDVDGVLVQLWRRAVPRSVPKLAGQSELVEVVLRVLGSVFDSPTRLAEVYARQAAFKTLRTALDQSPPASQATRSALLAGLMDGLDAWASQADAQGRPLVSMQLAQTSLIALQVLPCPAEPWEAEAWLARVQAQERRYSWSRMTPAQALDKALVLSYGGYAGSLRLVAEHFCAAAAAWYAKGQASNQLWSAMWLALERLRLALQLFYALSRQPLPKSPEPEKAYFALKYLLDHYHQAQRVLAAMISRNLQPGREMSMWVQVMLNEGATTLNDTQAGYDIQECVAVKNALQTHGYGPEALQRLGELVANLKPIAVGPAKPATSADSSEAADYCAEEDDVYRQVLSELLRKAYLNGLSSIYREDGLPSIPPPPGQPTPAEREAYYEAWLAQHPGEHAPAEVLNLAPTLRSMPECMAEYQTLLEPRSATIQALAAHVNMASLATRSFAPLPVPEVWRHALYWRYTPYHQYPDPVGSWGQQMGLHLSRVCFNDARDAGLFFYDLDHNNFILGSVALVRKEQGRWVVQES